MSGKTTIEWCDKVFNPVTGCTPVSAGCSRCYAKRIADRFWGDRKFSDVYFHPDRLIIPAHWTKPQTIFITSMGDLFHENVTESVIREVLNVVGRCYWHTFISLTKRPDRMRDVITDLVKEGDYFSDHWCGPEEASDYFPNLILGVSVEDQPSADLRIPLLLQTPAAKRMVSVEPMLGDVDLTCLSTRLFPYTEMCALTGWAASGTADNPVQYDGLPKLDFVVAGCESGPRRRPCNIDWMRSLRDQCVEAGVPFFLKAMDVDGKIVKMPVLDGRVWDQRPEGVR